MKKYFSNLRIKCLDTLWIDRYADVETHPSDNASNIIEASRRVSPVPPKSDLP